MSDRTASDCGPDGQDAAQIAHSLVSTLRSYSQSDREAYAMLYSELRRIAHARMRFERRDHTLQATALVNEAFIKLFKGNIPRDFWTDERRAIGCIVRAMGELLNDHADAYRSAKRGGGSGIRIQLVDDQRGAGDGAEATKYAALVTRQNAETVVAVREALVTLRKASPRQADVVEMMFYGGLTHSEVATLLEVSQETVKVDWRKAKAFLRVLMGSGCSV